MKLSVNITRIVSAVTIGMLGITIWFLAGANDSIKKSIFLLKNEKTGLEKKIKNLYTEKGAITVELKTAKQEKDMLVSKIGHYKTQLDGLTIESDNLKNNLSGMNETVSQKDEEIQILKKSIEEYKMELDDLIQRLGSSKGGIGDKIELAPITVKPGVKRSQINAKVLDVNKDYEFVVINAGRKDGIVEGDTLFVFRGRKLLGRVVVERLAEDAAITRGLYRTLSRTVRKGDRVSF